MKVLYVITRAIAGGAQRNVFDLMRCFSRHNDVHLAVGNRGYLTESAEASGFPVTVLPSLKREMGIRQEHSAINEVVALAEAIRPDLIHAHSGKAGVIARLAGAKARVPVVFTAHGWSFSSGTPPVRRAFAAAVEFATVRLARHVICVCESDRRTALRLGVVRSSNVSVINYGIEDIAFRRDENHESRRRIRAVMVARFSEQKDQASVVKAVASLPEHLRPDVDFVGVGEGMETVTRMIDELKVGSHVRMLMERLDVDAILAASDIFVLATHYEGLPISIIESMRSGLPVIATGVNGVPELIEQGQSGFLVGRRDVAGLAKALATLVSDNELRITMGQRGRELYVEKYKLDTMIDKTASVYADVVSPASMSEVTARPLTDIPSE
jgi:glycosyltransferase involved in cell wall biosynthesis